MIFHIAREAAWDRARAEGVYRADSLASEGFIHLSTAEQVCDTAARFYAGATDLVLLAVDPDRLTAELRWEEAPGGLGTFPHLYGPLDLAAVTGATPWCQDPDGRFRLPPTGP